MTCGLTQVGIPNDDQGEHLGLHGRIHHTPASQIAAESQWLDDVYTMSLRGVLEESRIFGERLILRREIRSVLGQNSLTINDSVENAGHEPVPHMLLYHFNFGYPLMTPDTTVEYPSQSIEPREEKLPIEDYDKWEAPQVGYQERVYYHSELVSQHGWAAAKIVNPYFPSPTGPQTLEVKLSWRTENLDRLTQWKMPGTGTHVLGIEPGNCYPAGRAAERQAGTLVMLEPGQTLDYELHLDVHVPDSDEGQGQ